jgi:peptidoglycan hydrolase-like protein with peptidoglycan-binding domain
VATASLNAAFVTAQARVQSAGTPGAVDPRAQLNQAMTVLDSAAGLMPTDLAAARVLLGRANRLTREALQAEPSLRGEPTAAALSLRTNQLSHELSAREMLARARNMGSPQDAQRAARSVAEMAQANVGRGYLTQDQATQLKTQADLIVNGAHPTVGTAPAIVEHGNVNSRLVTDLSVAAPLSAAPSATVASLAEVRNGGGRVVLEPGSQGAAVTELKDLLRQLGYSVSDGDSYDQSVVNAVRTFQGRNNIEQNGRVGLTTLTAIDRVIARGPDTAVIRQGDFPGVVLPGGRTVARVGCMVSSYIMAANQLTGGDLRPDQTTIDRLARAGAFSGNMVVHGPMQSALGLREASGDWLDTLRNGGALVVAVQSRTSGRRDGHWVTVIGANADGTLRVLDPGTGSVLTGRIEGNNIRVDGYGLGSGDIIALTPR